MTNKKINGMDYISDAFDVLQKECEMRCAENPNLVIGHDVESGYLFVWTKEQRDKYLEFFESLNHKLELKPTGKMIMFGTGGQMDKNSYWLKCFGK